jgi:plastocyanin
MSMVSSRLGARVCHVVLLLFVAGSAQARDGDAIRGKVELVADGKQRVEAGEVSDTVVYYLPKGIEPRTSPGRFSVDTRSKGFSPSLLVVPAGSVVSFPNRDTILHNVFSRSGANSFDLGFYGSGVAREHTFRRPGLVVVNCSVHQSMRANILVLSTPYFTRPDRSGRYRLDNLPAGSGSLVFWHPRAAPTSLQVAVPADTVPAQRLIASKPPIDAHASGRH